MQMPTAPIASRLGSLSHASESPPLTDAACPPLLPVGLVVLEGGDHLLAQQVDGAHGHRVGHRPLPAPEDQVPWVHQVYDVLQLLDHGIGVPGDYLGGGMGLFVVEAGTAGGDVGSGRPPLFTLALHGGPAHVPWGRLPVTRRDPEGSPQLPVEI